ncbi:SMP-30/gluconolactonase/LRE family protein [Nakamurella antarctica]|uniref:SMP-30/gluconolactonase/LRE family protein n=1 Tax=Nakamurella antarctica TaxID=1902245 RepID=A0A3G8ZNC9_9ACTN|nr:SMP-30/gluconolactonase/LRE family protein [Nakamurella antarctica]AZI58842.1 SMP-30/gluconolactonase/LRE family protein [Nakamurella antarctica]
MTNDLRCVIAGIDLLGESPVWSVADQTLYWVDIVGRVARSLSPSTGRRSDWSMPSTIGALALRRSGGALVALRSGFTILDFETGDLAAIHDPEAELPENLFNDGACDRAGRFWAGTVHQDETDPLGSLYRLGTDLHCTRMLSGLILANGIGWSPDNSTMYFIDSGQRRVFAFEYDLERGEMGEQRVFAEIAERDGFPDGLTVDSEGNVWVALWDGWAIRKYSPNGVLAKEISVPVPRPTSCAFGGPDLTTLYITSARDGLTPQELTQAPLSGSLFSLQTSVRGIPEPTFGG